MLNGRLYRAAFVPFLFALAIAAFSLAPRPGPLTSTLAPDAFEGEPAFAELQSLVARFPARRPGSPGDARLASHIEQTLKGLGGTAGGGFSVRRETFEGQTIDGERTLTNVIAHRPGSTSAAPILIVAHRDAAARGSAAELSGTAALLELARVFAARETRRAIVLAFTSGGSGGDAGAARLSAEQGSFDAAIVLGDLAGTPSRRPFVVPFSDGYGSGPLQLQRTVSNAITHEAGTDPGAPSALGQLAHLIFPFATGEQGVLDQRGVPAVLVQVSSERGPSSHEPVSSARLQAFGRSVLDAVDALDTAPDITQAKQRNVLLQHQTLPAWAIRLLAFTLLLPAAVAAVDGLARVRRRRQAVGRWTLWTLSCALPFLGCALFCYLLGGVGILGLAPSVPVSAAALGFGGTALTAVLAVALTFALAWLLWTSVLHRLRWQVRPDPDIAGLPIVLVLVAVDLFVWLLNPFTALLAIPATHAWLLLAEPDLRPRRLGSLGLLAIGALPLLLLIAFYAEDLGLGPGGVAWTGVLLLAGMHVAFGSALLWSLALGCLAAAAMLAWRSPDRVDPESPPELEVTIRGPLSYAGPGSLGGTESALRR